MGRAVTSHSAMLVPRRLIHVASIGIAILLGGMSGGAQAFPADETLVRVAPAVSGQFKTVSNVADDTASFEYTDGKNRIRYEWRRPAPGSASWIGQLSASVNGGPKLAWDTQSAPQWIGGATRLLIASKWSVRANGATLALTFGSAAETATITLGVHLQGQSLIVDMDCDKPFLTILDMGGWRASPGARKIEIPYDPFATYYLPEGKAFASAFYDWTVSHASQQNGSRLLYEAKTDGRHNPLHERLVIVASSHIREVFPRAPHDRSAYFEKVAGKLVIDIVTTEPFDRIADGLRHLRDAGLRDCIVILHNWQHAGYDNALPEHLPANEVLGGDSGLKKVAQEAKRTGCSFLLHENYIDYYRDYPGFDKSDVAKNQDGSLVKGWFNKRFGAQSYYFTPAKALPVARSEAAEIRDAFGLDGVFLDVNSSFLPWQRIDMDASVDEAAKTIQFVHLNEQLFGTLQDVVQGPVLGEGNAHFFWTGMLDGVEAQVSVGYKGGGPDIPPIPDFDLLSIHSVQSNFGMGFYFRWNLPEASAGIDWARLPIEENRYVASLYRAQEIAFGHNPFRSGTAWADPKRYNEEEGLVGPLARRYSRDDIRSVEYLVDGNWVNADVALAGSDELSVVKIAYSHGLTVIANLGRGSFEINGMKLPRGGWMASGPDLKSYDAVVKGRRQAYSKTPNELFADAYDAASTAGIPEVIDFGDIQTNGSVRLTHLKDTWELQAFLPHTGGEVSFSSHSVEGKDQAICAGTGSAQYSKMVGESSIKISGSGWVKCLVH